MPVRESLNIIYYLVTSGMDDKAHRDFDAWLYPPHPAPVTSLDAAVEQYDRIRQIESAGGEVVAG